MSAQLRLMLDGILIVAYEHKMPASGNPQDLACPMCAKRHEHWAYDADVTQYGFQWDRIATILKCEQCSYRVFVAYEVEHKAEKPRRKRVRK